MVTYSLDRNVQQDAGRAGQPASRAQRCRVHKVASATGGFSGVLNDSPQQPILRRPLAYRNIWLQAQIPFASSGCAGSSWGSTSSLSLHPYIRCFFIHSYVIFCGQNVKTNSVTTRNLSGISRRRLCCAVSRNQKTNATDEGSLKALDRNSERRVPEAQTVG
jgi:hypothetical protein